MSYQVVPQPNYAPQLAPVIRLIGVGGGGCNAVEQMIKADFHSVEFTCVNTDAQALAKYNPDHVIQLGNYLTRGLGAGTDPEVGRLAAEEDKEKIAAAIGNTDMLFLTAGMGGGTGTGAVPVIARIAREMGVLTVAVVTKPFAFEGGKRRQVAEEGIAKLRANVDSLIVVPNENLLTHLGPNISLIDAFAASNDVLTNAVQSIAELITNPGLINVDFADVKSVMTEMGESMMSTGRGIGEFRARDAAIAATESPLLDDIDLREARGILANVTASADLSMGEFQIVGEILDQITAKDANVVIGTVFDQNMRDEIRVTVVATGLNPSESRRPARPGSRHAKQSHDHSGRGKGSQKKRKSLFNLFSSADDKKPEKSKQTPSHQPVSIEARLQQDDIYRPEPARKQPDQVNTNSTPAADFAGTDREELPGLCKICGESSYFHTENCPQNIRLRPATPFEFSGSKINADATSHTADDVDHLRSNDEPDNSQPSVTVPRREFQTGKKKSSSGKHIAGIVAGTTILMSAFYFIYTSKQNLGTGDLVSTEGSTNIAERKLKDSNRRLSVIDE